VQREGLKLLQVSGEKVLAGNLTKTKVVQTSATHRALPRLLSAPDHTSGCPELRPTSSNQSRLVYAGRHRCGISTSA
jgi:hypothetical protein